MDSLKAPEVLLIGAGALGIYFCGRIARAGAKISVVARADFEALKQNGGVYTIEGENGNFQFKPERILRDASEMPVEPDCIVFATKLLPGIDAAKLCRPAVAKKTAILVIQNGLGSDAALAKAFPDNEVIGSIAYIGASRPKPAHVSQVDNNRLIMGLHPKGRSQTVEMLCELLNKGGVEAKVSDNIVRERWKKLLWNAPYNPISVLGGNADTKEIMSLPETAKLAEEIMVEIAAIATAAGHPLERELVDANLKFTSGLSPYKTSMLHDHLAGRPLEVEALLGDPLRIADELGVEAPAIRTMYALLKLVSRRKP